MPSDGVMVPGLPLNISGGRCRRAEDKSPQPWPSDRIQAIAYAVLLSEGLGELVNQARIRYHADNVTAFVEIDDSARKDLRRAIARARELRRTTDRPPVHENERVCVHCSLAPVCLPEEERLAEQPRTNGNESELTAELEDSASVATKAIPRLFPSDRQKQSLHVVSPRAYVSRSGETLVVTVEDQKQKVPIQDIDTVVIHGFGQVTTQAIQLCAYHSVSIQWLTMGGRFVAGTTSSAGRVQQRIRQFSALTQGTVRLRLTRQLVLAKVETQLRYLLRCTRGNPELRQSCHSDLEQMREALKKIPTASSADSLRGLEGIAAKSYFASIPKVLGTQVADELRPNGRTKHPPRDRFNALLSFGYALIQTLVHRSLTTVGLEPAFGFFHQPRTSAPPLVLDVMELFRTPLWDMPVIGSINRGQWDLEADFQVFPGHIWLSETGRKKAIELFEQRLTESYKHPHTGQSLTYSRIVELEARLLEKEWTGCEGLFAQLRLR